MPKGARQMIIDLNGLGINHRKLGVHALGEETLPSS